MNSSPKGACLEQYTLAHPQEVLLVTAELEGDIDQIVVFRGYSSALMRSTAFDPDVPVLPETATIRTIDRLEGPYNPSQPRYIQRDLSWTDFLTLMDPPAPDA